MNFKITSLKIQNFKAFENFESNLYNKTCTVSDNEGGKSTLATAIVWTLFGKDIENNSTFDIVPLGKYGEVSPAVELECLVNGEKPLTLKRQYLAKLTRDKQFSEYKTVCFVNGIEYNQKDFKQYITDNICEEEVFRVLSVPKTFIETPPKKDKELVWQSQRRLLTSLVDIASQNDLEYAYGDTQYAPLIEPLKRHGDISVYLKLVKTQIKETEKLIAEFEAKLEQQESNRKQTQYGTLEEVKAEIEKIENEILNLKTANEEYRSKNKNEELSKVKEQIATLQAEKHVVMQEYQKRIIAHNDKKNAIEGKLQGLELEMKSLLNKQSDYAKAIAQLTTSKVRVTCETCNQRLSEESIATSKKTILERISKGKKLIESVKEQQTEINNKIKNLRDNLAELQQPTYPTRDIELSKEIETLTNSLLDGSQAIENIEGYSDKLGKLTADLENVNAEKRKVEDNIQCEEKITALEEENSENQTKYSRLKMLHDTCKIFISNKQANLEEEINKLFTNVTIELFEKNKSNDDIKETCVVKFNGIEYQGLSLSTRLIGQLELVKVFQMKYNVKVPLLIDNKESITQTVDLDDTQVIEFAVSKELCPKCNGESGRRNNYTGLWTCKSCGNEWKKKFEIREVE